MNKILINWLLDSDISIQYQVYRDLLGLEKKSLRMKIAAYGWGAAFISRRLDNGHWGLGFYQPKWTSSHYTLLDLKNLSISPNNLKIKQTLNKIFNEEKGEDGGLNPSGTISNSDVCINGMVLNYASYFQVDEEKLKSVVDFLLSQQMNDGGFNCHSNRKGAKHSSLHTTLSVAEGILEYSKNGYKYHLKEIQKAELNCREFILQHKLFKSDKTGNIINKKMLMLPYPSRWYYDILRALDYFQSASIKYDNRMKDAIEVLLRRRGKNEKWLLQAKHPGQTHFEMEKAGKPSRWNTLRALRVLKHFDSKYLFFIFILTILF